MFEIIKKSEIKDKYFYRTQKWAWLDNEMIFVLDSDSPRIITLDPWPQLVYLNADGQRTIYEYVMDLSNQLSKSGIPKKLDKNVLDIIKGLMDDGQLVKLSDSKVVLNKEVRNPFIKDGEIELVGKWKGEYSYTYPQELEGIVPPSVQFELEIQKVNGNKFTGRVEDLGENGGTTGIGTIIGKFDKRIIEFLKVMPFESMRSKSGESIVSRNKKHVPVKYTGKFLGENKISGNWKFKNQIIWSGLIPKYISSGEGEFVMEKN